MDGLGSAREAILEDTGSYYWQREHSGQRLVLCWTVKLKTNIENEKMNVSAQGFQIL